MNFGKPKNKKEEEYLDDDEDDLEDDDGLLSEDSKNKSKDDDDLGIDKDPLYDPMFDDMGFDNYGRPPPMEKHNDLLKGLTNFSKHIRKLYNSWLGITWDEGQRKFIRNTELPQIMNMTGANWNISYIETYVRDNNVLANLSEEEYRSLNMDINRTLMLSFAKRYKEFGFTCYSDVIRVWNEVENAALLALSGAGGGKYSEFLGGQGGGVIQYRGNYNENYGQPDMMMRRPMMQQPKGIMSRFRNWLMGGKT